MADLTTLLSKFLDSLYFTEGRAAGVLTSTATPVNSPADTNENDAWSYSLPANALSVDGKGVRIYAFGSFAANGNTKTVKLYFGSTSVTSSGLTTSGVNWEWSAVVLRSSATAQILSGKFRHSTNSVAIASATPAETMSGAVTIRLTLQSGTGTAADLVFKGAIVEVLG